MDETYIRKYFDEIDLDIRKKSPGYSRFMDQKVTPDVLRFVSECIYQYVQTSPNGYFSASDIQYSPYFMKNIPREFSKPTPEDKRTKHEYDKWSAQIIQILRFSKILSEGTKNGRATEFNVIHSDILEYIFERPRNSYTFLLIYLTKLLKDSGFYHNIENYRDLYLAGRLDQSDFYELKEKFESFIITNTNIKKLFEPRRIFPKVVNIFAAEYHIPGSVSGVMSKFPFMASDLIYNRINFRDKNKSKAISRQEQIEKSTLIERINPSYRITNAKRRIKELHPRSEVNDQLSTGDATQVHHIFPDNEFPQIADRLENLIRLTPTQHNTKAHPNNKTRVIDKEYQFVCLIAKSHNIEESINKGEFDYSREAFIGVINTGLGLSLSYDLTFEDIRKELKKAF